MITVTVYRAIFWLLLTAVALLSIMSLEPLPKVIDWQDKLHHLIAYAVLFWCLLGAYSEQHRLWTLAISLAVFSGLVEVAQSYTGHRQAEFMDLLANCTGILLVAFWHLLRRGL